MIEIAAVVLAAGAARRFGGGKVRAVLDGRPLVAHVLAAARDAGIRRMVLVLGRDAVEVRAALLAGDPSALDGVLVAVNPAPERGLASSLRLGLTAASAAPAAPAGGPTAPATGPAGGPAAPGVAPAGIVVLLGDQPRVRPAVIRALVEAAVAAPPNTLAVIPAYAADDAPNPVLVLPAGRPAALAVEGDRGLGPFLAAHAGRVVRVPVAGSNPDVDTPADLQALEGSAT